MDDGSEVLFSRDYLPLWRLHDGRVERLEPWLWINGVNKEVHFSTLADTPGWLSDRARTLALARLADWRISTLPRLVEAMPYLFEPQSGTFHRGARALYQAAGKPEQLPSFAGLSNRLSW